MDTISPRSLLVTIGLLLIASTANADCVGYSGPGGGLCIDPGGGAYAGPGGGAYTGSIRGAYTSPGGWRLHWSRWRRVFRTRGALLLMSRRRAVRQVKPTVALLQLKYQFAADSCISVRHPL